MDADAGTARDRDAGGMEVQPAEGRTDRRLAGSSPFVSSSREGIRQRSLGLNRGSAELL
jgi:hypothetical protein